MTGAFPRAYGQFDDLTDVEEAVIASAVAGEIAVLGEGVPETAVPEMTVRAGVVWYLALGGCAAKLVHEKGVQIQGAWIDGVIDLKLCRNVRRVLLSRCRIEAIEAMDAGIDGVLLSGSETGWLNFQGARVRGDVFLQHGFHANGEVRLTGAEIGGQLSCASGRFENADGDALDADGAHIAGHVLLRAVGGVPVPRQR